MANVRTASVTEEGTLNAPVIEGGTSVMSAKH